MTLVWSGALKGIGLTNKPAEKGRPAAYGADRRVPRCLCALLFTVSILLLPAQEWEVETAGSGGFLSPFSIAVLNNGDIVGASGVGGDSGLVVRFDPGAVQWARYLVDNGPGWPSAGFSKVIVAANGDIVAVGQERRNSFSHGLVARLDAAGNLLWSSSVTTDADFHYFIDVVESLSGDLYVVGHTGPNGSRNEVVARLNAAGALQWLREVDHPGVGFARQVFISNDTLVVFGYTDLGAGARDISVMRWDLNGNPLLFRTFGSWNHEFTHRVVPDSTNGFVVSYLRNATVPAVFRLGAELFPLSNALVITSPFSMNTSGGLVWYAGTQEFVIAGQAWDPNQYFAMALRASLASGAIVWERTFTNSQFISTSRPYTSPNSILMSAAPLGFNTNGSYPVNMALIDAATGDNYQGAACAPGPPLLAGSYTEPLVVNDHLVPVLTPFVTVRTAIPNGGRQLMVTPCGGLVLPVELLDLRAEQVGAGIRVEWVTATEQHNAFFEILRSTDAERWSVIGQLSGAGNSLSVQHYDWLDRSPLPGMNYYRLRQVDADGSSTYSHTVSAWYSKQVAGALLPSGNLVGRSTMLTFNEPVWMVDVTGRVVDGPGTTLWSPDRAGVYLLRAKDRAEWMFVE